MTIRTITLKCVIDDLYHGRRDDGLWAELLRAPAAAYGTSFYYLLGSYNYSIGRSRPKLT